MRRFAVNHITAELVSAFRVISTPSSRPTGSSVTEHPPMTAKIAYSAPVLSGRTISHPTHISLQHQNQKGKRQRTSPDQRQVARADERTEDLDGEAQVVREHAVVQRGGDERRDEARRDERCAHEARVVGRISMRLLRPSHQ